MSTRRRFVSIMATCAAVGPLSIDRALGAGQVSIWKGNALGAAASLTLVHPDRARARALIDRCVAEVRRLEAVFSLYRTDSALVRLNAHGVLHDPPHELVELLSRALTLARASGGAFDPTVQPLFELYARHFAVPGAAAGGPPMLAIERVLRVVDFSAVEVGASRIRLQRPGMAVTLNGIAQGFITDRVATLLRGAGFDDVLIDLGETRVLGHRPGGGAWRAGIADPHEPTRALLELALGEQAGLLPALATSAGYGTCFGSDPRIHHLFDPHTGRSANYYASVSVSAPGATVADGLSTALSILPPARTAALLASYAPVRAFFVDGEGRVEVRAAA